MKKGYFAVWFDLEEGSEFNCTYAYKTPEELKKKINFFESPVAEGHVVIMYSDGKSIRPVEETWMPSSQPKLNWRKFTAPE